MLIDIVCKKSYKNLKKFPAWKLQEEIQKYDTSRHQVQVSKEGLNLHQNSRSFLNSILTGKVPFISNRKHEIMHALGFWHEQQRGDRDLYVQVHRENCEMSDGEWRANMDKIPWLDTGHQYDFDSIMQYDGFACSNNTLPTITLLSNNQVGFFQTLLIVHD